MQFSYSQYFRGGLILPLFVSLFVLSILVRGVTEYLLPLLTKTKEFQKHDWLCAILIIAFCSFFLLLEGGRLFNGGIHLIHERESCAVTISGEISSMDALGVFEFPELKSEYGYGKTNGVQFIINGNKCSAPVAGDLVIGDMVQVTYLPQSGYILFIQRIA